MIPLGPLKSLVTFPSKFPRRPKTKVENLQNQSLIRLNFNFFHLYKGMRRWA